MNGNIKDITLEIDSKYQKSNTGSIIHKLHLQQMKANQRISLPYQITILFISTDKDQNNDVPGNKRNVEMENKIPRKK